MHLPNPALYPFHFKNLLQIDTLTLLSVLQGIIDRDEIVFKAARSRNIPIVFVTSGGYQKCTARIIADSIINLKGKGLLPDHGS